MTTPRGILRVHQQGEQADVQVVGWGRMYESLPLRRYAAECLARGVMLFRIDLRHCTYLDSTFLGTLLHLKRSSKRLGCGDVILVSPSAECRRLLDQIGVLHFFVTETSDEVAAAWQELACTRDDPAAFNRSVVEAHEELAGLGGAAGEQFRPVARCLARDCSAESDATADARDAAKRTTP